MRLSYLAYPDKEALYSIYASLLQARDALRIEDDNELLAATWRLGARRRGSPSCGSNATGPSAWMLWRSAGKERQSN